MLRNQNELFRPRPRYCNVFAIPGTLSDPFHLHSQLRIIFCSLSTQFTSMNRPDQAGGAIPTPFPCGRKRRGRRGHMGPVQKFSVSMARANQQQWLQAHFETSVNQPSNPQRSRKQPMVPYFLMKAIKCGMDWRLSPWHTNHVSSADGRPVSMPATLTD